MNEHDKEHPSESELQAFLMGRSDGEAAADIERHIIDCGPCCEVLAALNRRKDGFLTSLRSAEQTPKDPEPASELPAPRNDSGRGSDVVSELEGTRIGPYRLLQPIGEGGMGIIYMCDQEHPVRRRVALKVIKPGMDSKQVIARFEAERQALAMMDHISIAKVFDAGTTPDGLPFFVMELVRGRPITEYCDQHKLPIRERLKLFVQVCNAIQHAHQKGIIHRDIKPSNVLVCLYDGRPVPKIIDFGVAKALDQRLTERTMFTRFGQIVGTLEYMSPEQAELSQIDVDTRSDIFSLGVLLYELLTATTPLESRRLRETAFSDVLRIIREEEPQKPSTRLSSSGETLSEISARRSTDPHKLDALVRGDLDWIVMKTLEKDRARRYETANALARDVQRYVDNEPIEARPPSTLYRLQKLVRRHQRLVVSFVLFSAVLVLSTAFAMWQAVNASRAGEAAMRDRDRAIQSERAERWASYLAHIAAAGGNLDLDNADAARRALEAAPPEHRNWEWRHYWQRLHHSRRLVLEGHRDTVWSVAFSPDGRRVASYSANSVNGEVRLWDARTGRIIKVLPGDRGGNREVSMAFSPDSQVLATPGPDGSICLWAAEDGQRQAILSRHKGYSVQALFSPDGTLLLSRAGADNTVRLWDVRTHTAIDQWDLQVPLVSWIGFSPDGNYFAAATSAGSVSVWDAEKRALAARWRAHDTQIDAAVFSPDGRRLITSSNGYIDCALRMWSLPDGNLIATMPGHVNAIHAVQFSPDGSRLASASIDQTVRLWDGKTGEALVKLRGHAGAVHDVQFSPDGNSLASASRDRTVRIWDVVDGSLQSVFFGHSDEVNSLQFSPSGESLATASRDHTVGLWDMTLSGRTDVIRGHTSYVYDVAFSPDGEHVASAAWDGTFRLWSVTRREELLRLDTDRPRIATGVAFDPRGDRLATLERGAMRLWDLKSGECLHAIELPKGFKGFHLDARIAFSPSGALLAAGTGDGEIWWWDGSAKRVATTPAHSERCHDVAFSPDSLRLASAGHDSFVHVWDVLSTKRIATLRGHSRPVTSVAFNSAGTLLATSSEDGTVRLWDAVDFTERAVLDHGRHVYDVAFHPDGTRLATACVDNSIRIWDVKTGSQVAELRGHQEYVYALAFSPDGTRLVSGSGDFTIRIWDTVPAAERTSPNH